MSDKDSTLFTSESPAMAKGTPREERGDDAPSLEAGGFLGGRYRIVRFIARGGMGEVFEAFDEELRVPVAVKVATRTTGRALDRFRREVMLARRVTHTNVCRLFEIGFETIRGEEVPYCTMELLHGKTLSARLEHGALPLGEARAIVGQLVAGLQAAHDAGVVHRDFKSNNIMLVEDGRAVITDFGLAREEPGANTGGATLTADQALVGTPAYMAPEQIACKPATHATDVYALGIVMFEMVTGELPFRADTSMATAVMRLQQAAPSPRKRRPELPPAWDRAIARCLEIDPAKRPSHASEVLAAIDGARPGRRVWLFAMAGGLVAAASIATALSLASRGHHVLPRAETCNGTRALATVYQRDSIAKLVVDPKVMGPLDGWAHAWVASYDRNCERPDDDSAARRVCLEDERDQISLLVDPSLVHALAVADLAAVLPDPAECQNAPRLVAPPLPQEPSLRARDRELRALMLVSRERLLSNRAIDKAVLDRMTAAVSAVDGTDDPGVRADAIAVTSIREAIESRSDRDPSATARAYEQLKQAAGLAEAAGEERTRMQLDLAIAEMTVSMPGYWSDLDDVLAQAEAAVDRTKDLISTLALDGIRAEVADKRGGWTEAIDGYERTRRGWLARGSSDVHARFTIMLATALLNRHLPGDVERALAALDDALTRDLSGETRRTVELMRSAIAEAVGRADAETIEKLGYTRDAGASGGGTLVATVSGLEAANDADPPPGTGAGRHGLPEVMVATAKQGWRVPVGADGVFTLTNVPPATYSVLAFVNSSAGDLQMIRRDATIHGGETTKLDLPYPVGETSSPTFALGTPSPQAGIVIALPGNAPATIAELTSRIRAAPWWTVATAHTVKRPGGIVAEATLGTFGRATFCWVERGASNGSDPSLFLGPSTSPLQCH